MLRFEDPVLSNAYLAISTLTRSQLKELVCLSRHGGLPITRPHVLLERCSDVISVLRLEPFDFSKNEEPNSPGQSISYLMQDAATQSIVISMCVSQEMPKEVEEQVRLESFVKEFKASTGGPPPSSSINWSLFFTSPTNSIQTVLPGIQPSSSIKAVRKALRSWKAKVAGTLIFPHGKDKYVSSQTSNHYNTVIKPGESSLVPRTSREIVSTYIQTGFFPSGACEMKQVWTRQHLKPRTYFSAGGDALRGSIYVRDVLNSLVDCIESCNRFSRVSKTRLRSKRDADPFFIYDFTSFTSQFREQQALLDALSEFVSGVTVLVVAPGLRVEPCDLGDLIRDYRESANTNPEFYVSCMRDILELTDTFSHATAGFLGVYGNIAVATFGHALAISAAADNLEEQSVAGDDGAVAIDSSRRSHLSIVHSILPCIGDYSVEKGYSAPPSAVYLKRRAVKEERRLTIFDYVEHPILALAMETPPPHIDRLADFSDRRYQVASACRGALDSLWGDFGGDLPIRTRDILLSWFQKVYDLAKLPTTGCFFGTPLFESYRQLNKSVDVTVYPICKQIFTMSPFEYTRGSALTAGFTFNNEELVQAEFSEDLEMDFEFRSNSNAGLSFLVKMGYLVVEEIENCWVTGLDAVERFKKRPNSSLFVYVYRVNRRIGLSSMMDIGAASRRGVDPVGTTMIKRKRLMYYDVDEPDELKRRKYGTGYWQSSGRPLVDDDE